MLIQVNGNPYTLHFAHRKDEQQHWSTKCIFHQGKCTIKGHIDGNADFIFRRASSNGVLAACGASYASAKEAIDGNADCGTTLFVGIARCNPMDQFDKAKGRIIALKRALMNVSRDVREQVWLAYFGTIGSYPQ